MLAVRRELRSLLQRTAQILVMYSQGVHWNIGNNMHSVGTWKRCFNDFNGMYNGDSMGFNGIYDEKTPSVHWNSLVDL